MGFYHWATMVPELVTPDYSTAAGGTIRGEKIEVGCYRYPTGTGAKPHAHPNEQMICVLEGRLRCRLAADWRELGPGEVMHIPPLVEHEVTALDGEVRVLFCKDIVPGWSVRDARWEWEPLRR